MPTAFPLFINKSVIAKQKLAFIKQMHESTETNEINSFCNELENENKFYLEASRLIIDNAYKSISTFSFFMSAIFAIEGY